MEAEFPAIYGDTNVAIEDMEDPICLRPYYQDDDLNRHIGPGVTYPASFFSTGIKVTELDIPVFEEQITSLDGVDQYSLFQEALTWFDFDLDEVSSMSFKAKQMSIQQGMKQYGDSGKKSALKEIENLTGNECFEEIDYASLTQEMKDTALPIFMFMIMKRNGDLKSRGVANGSLQRVYTNKDDCSSPTPAFKYINYYLLYWLP